MLRRSIFFHSVHPKALSSSDLGDIEIKIESVGVASLSATFEGQRKFYVR